MNNSESHINKWFCNKIIFSVFGENVTAFMPVSVSENQELAVIGHQEENDYVGCVYVVQKKSINSEWKIIQKITGERTNGRFGSAVAISDDGNTIAVSSCAEEVVHVFSKKGKTWNKIIEITEERGSKTRYGYELFLDHTGKTLAVSAPEEDQEQGAVYVYRINKKGDVKLLGRITEPGTRYFGHYLYLYYDGSDLTVKTPDKTRYRYKYKPRKRVWQKV
jgi:hypothetical protein